MNSERMRLRGEEGFTLIEVLVAMVILAIGLLGLEALGIGAARSIVQAEEQSNFTMLATRVMEDRIRDIRANPANPFGQACGTDAATGFYFCANVTNVAGVDNTARVVVEVRENQNAPNPFTLDSYVYDPQIP